MIDWQVQGTHYDSRVVRSCQPGRHEETDPGGNLYWEETSSVFGIFASGTRRGWAYLVNGNLDTIVGSAEHFDSAGSGALPWATGTAPNAISQGYARVRMRYGNGQVLSCNPLPVEIAAFQGCS